MPGDRLFVPQQYAHRQRLPDAACPLLVACPAGNAPVIICRAQDGEATDHAQHAAGDQNCCDHWATSKYSASVCLPVCSR